MVESFPHNLIEQDGLDRGRIKDIELAMVGAQAEERVRNQHTLNVLEYYASQFYAGENVFVRPYSSQEDQIQRRIKDKSGNAMEKAIKCRVERELLLGGMSKSKAKGIAILLGKKFIEEYYCE